jgi:hypothetical protein
MRIKTLSLFLILSVILLNAQIYTPGAIILGTPANTNIGIGTDNPVTKLDVIDNGRISTTLRSYWFYRRLCLTETWKYRLGLWSYISSRG